MLADTSNRATFFNTRIVEFPHSPEEKISTCDFLEGSKGVVSIVELFGKPFAPVKYDMNGNINKITKKYVENKIKYKFLEDLILEEKNENTGVVIDAVLWLRRGLHFILCFFQCIVSDKACNQDLRPYLKQAYENTLERYHGWTGIQLFKLLTKFAPTRSDLLLTLSLNEPGREYFVVEDMSNFTCHLDFCIQRLSTFYVDNGLESNAKV